MNANIQVNAETIDCKRCAGPTPLPQIINFGGHVIGNTPRGTADEAGLAPAVRGRSVKKFVARERIQSENVRGMAEFDAIAIAPTEIAVDKAGLATIAVFNGPIVRGKGWSYFPQEAIFGFCEDRRFRFAVVIVPRRNADLESCTLAICAERPDGVADTGTKLIVRAKIGLRTEVQQEFTLGKTNAHEFIVPHFHVVRRKLGLREGAGCGGRKDAEQKEISEKLDDASSFRFRRFRQGAKTAVV